MKNPAALILVLVLGPICVLSYVPIDRDILLLRPKLMELLKDYMARVSRFATLYGEQVKAGTLKTKDITPYDEAEKMRHACSKKMEAAIVSNHKEYYAKMAILDRQANETMAAGSAALAKDKNYYMVGTVFYAAQLVRASAIMNDPTLMKEWQQVGDEQLKVSQECNVVFESYLKNYPSVWKLWEQSKKV